MRTRVSHHQAPAALLTLLTMTMASPQKGSAAVAGARQQDANAIANATAREPDLDRFEGMMEFAMGVMQERDDFKAAMHTFWPGCPEFDITKNRYTPQKMVHMGGVAEVTNVVPKSQRKPPPSAAERGSVLWKNFDPALERFKVCNAVGSTLIHYADAVATKKTQWFVEDFDVEDIATTKYVLGSADAEEEAGDDSEATPGESSTKQKKRRKSKKQKKKRSKPSASDKLMVTLRAVLNDATKCLDKAQTALSSVEIRDSGGTPAATELTTQGLAEEQTRLEQNLSDLRQLRDVFGMDTESGSGHSNGDSNERRKSEL